MNPLGLKRDIIPIWKPSYEAAKSPELLAVKKQVPQVYAQDRSEVVLADFLSNKNLGTAADLLNASMLEGKSELSVIAAEYVLTSKEKLPALDAISRKVLGLKPLDSPFNHPNEIAALRSRLIDMPQNPIAWVDLARAYTVINEREKSEKAMWVALRYSNNHRWISRMAARLFVHYEELGKAHRVLLLNENLRSDPWLLSTELAVARLAGRPLKNWNQAKKLVAASMNPIHLSELSSSIATSEILGGADKKARAFFKQSLIAPTSNSLAQIKWADRSYKLGFGKQIEATLAHSNNAHEAKYWEAYEKKNMLLALRCADAWWKEEPYSVSPPRAITYLASIVNDMPLLLRAADIALKANPGDVVLKLNYLFAQIGTLGYATSVEGKTLEKVTRTLRAIMHGPDKSEAAHAIANIGMLAYRTGEFDLGKAYYDHAEDYFEKMKNPSRLFLLLNHLREALIAESDWSGDIVFRIKSFISQPQPVISAAGEYYLNKVEQLKKQPGTWKDKFSHAFIDDESFGGAVEPARIISLEDASKKFWLPSDFYTANQALQLLKSERDIPPTKSRR
ncbi:hypothetical protein [Pseudomonas thivervalensis]|jgi:hypothetical protein|uniref:hypothetical protein n=1 Tax=Pseudomonas thivervalensis TaxID=86265 RepID=UPI003D656B19